MLIYLLMLRSDISHGLLFSLPLALIAMILKPDFHLYDCLEGKNEMFKSRQVTG